MGLFDQFPYTNLHELNLDWILQALKELEHTIEQFVSINALKYADPIQWDITTQYEKNTIVVNPQSGTAYISVNAVPSGVSLDNTDYWTPVFNVDAFVVGAVKNLANIYEESTTLTATVSSNAGDWLVWGDSLYKTLVNITAGDSYVVGSNIQALTIEDAKIEVTTMIGNLNNLSTTAKANLVSAINELVSNLAAEALARANADTALQGNIDAEAQTRANADTAINTKIGNLNNLDTTDKSSVVNAINEALTYSPNPRYITIADSYGEEPSVSESWQTLLGNYIYSSYPIINLHEGSAGIYHLGNNGHNAETLLSSNSGSITNKETVTDIIIGLGVNDWNDSLTDVKQAYTSLISYIRTTYVNAKIWFAFTGNNISWYGDQREKLINLLTLMTDACAKENCYFMDGVQYIMHNQRNVSADNVHPTIAGSTELAKAIASCLKNGKFDYVLATTCEASLTGGSSGICRVIIDGNTMSMSFPDLASGAVIAFTANNWIEIGTITNPVINTNGAVPVNAQLYTDAAGAPQTISVLINKDKIYGKLPVSITLSIMQINSFTFTVPSIWS